MEANNSPLSGVTSMQGWVWSTCCHPAQNFLLRLAKPSPSQLPICQQAGSASTGRAKNFGFIAVFAVATMIHLPKDSVCAPFENFISTFNHLLTKGHQLWVIRFSFSLGFIKKVSENISSALTASSPYSLSATGNGDSAKTKCARL